MSERLRGLEVLVRFSVEGVLQSGTFVKITDFTITPRDELPEADYLGEDESDIDYRHDGFDFSGTVHVLDASTHAYLSTLVFNHENKLAPPNVTMTVIYGFRSGSGATPVSETYRQCRMKLDETGFSGRKEYVASKISGKCKKYSVASAA